MQKKDNIVLGCGINLSCEYSVNSQKKIIYKIKVNKKDYNILECRI